MLGVDQIAFDALKRVVWRWESDAFGTTAPLQDPDNDGNATLINLRFLGQYYDAETQLHYNWNRYYDPSLGRYISSDPVGLDGGLNTFGYVGQSPLEYYDKEGLNRRCGTPYPRSSFGNPLGIPPLGVRVNMEEVYRAREQDAFLRELVRPSLPPNWMYRPAQPTRENVCRPTFPDHIFSSKAPYQVKPPIRELQGQYINDLEIVQPWRAFYDVYGRLVGRTDYNAGNRKQNIPETHYHTYEWGRGKTPYESGSHIPGEYNP